MPEQVETIKDIQNLAVSGFGDWQSLGHVHTKRKGNLLLLNYTKGAVYENRWNFLERVSRGLIIDCVTGEVVARPFDKFFNWGEKGTTDAKVVSVSEKVDGVLGILYRECGKLKIATRGSFDSVFAVWATKWLKENGRELDIIEDNLTFLFEIVYPGSRIVIDYEGYEGLYLTDIRNRHTGEYIRPYEAITETAHYHGFGVPETKELDTRGLIRSTYILPPNKEGYVAEFADGSRYKFKGQAYTKISKSIQRISFKNTLTHVREGTTQDMLNCLPDVYQEEAMDYISTIEKTVKEIIERTEGIVMACPYNPDENRREFAMWVNEYYKSDAAYIFNFIDGYDLKPLIYNLAFKNIEQN